MTTVDSRYGKMMRAMAEAQSRIQTYAANETSAAIVSVLVDDVTDAQADLLGEIRWEIARDDQEDETPIAGTVRSRHPVDRARVVTAFAEEVGGGRVQVVDGSDHVITIEATAVLGGFPVSVEAVWWTSEDGTPRPDRDEVQAAVAQAAAVRLEIWPTDEELADHYPEYDINEYE